MLKILETDRVFTDSPDAEDPACICSRCGKQIPEIDAPIIRAWPTEPGDHGYDPEAKGGTELRYCNECCRKMGFSFPDRYVGNYADEIMPEEGITRINVETRDEIHLAFKAEPMEASAVPVTLTYEPPACVCLTCGQRNDHQGEGGLCSNGGHDDWLELRDMNEDDPTFQRAMKLFGMEAEDLYAAFMDPTVHTFKFVNNA